MATENSFKSLKILEIPQNICTVAYITVYYTSIKMYDFTPIKTEFLFLVTDSIEK